MIESFFKNISQEEFNKRFSVNEKCLELLSEQKWKDGFVCRKCGHTNFCKGKAPYSRRCTKCKHEESASSHTIFHQCKIPIHEAFEIAYLVCNKPDISTYEISRVLNIRQMTCWKFKKKIINCIENRNDLTHFEKDRIIDGILIKNETKDKA
ncbi:MAG: transposase [Bacteroidales bacterium]|nr:transposase [Bacteroidales bacterium]